MGKNEGLLPWRYSITCVSLSRPSTSWNATEVSSPRATVK
jgi:hypothetical protein